MVNRVQLLLQNPHTTYAGILVIACQIASAWFPDYSVQLEKTSNLLLAYAVVMAGDAKSVADMKKDDNASGNTK